MCSSYEVSTTAYYSKAKQYSNIPVDYTLAKYVKKLLSQNLDMIIYTNKQPVEFHPKLHFG